jgi:acyl-CoA synthetase (AMP-forming)/AMP-acid ligase II
VVSAATRDRFVHHFAPAGFAPSAFCPSYGMAEATLTVTAATPETPPAELTVRSADLDRGAVVPGSGPGSRRLLSSGVPVPGTRVIVAGPRDVGEILVAGPQVFPGYRTGDAGPDAAGFWRTGDTGFLHDGHLFVLGRCDDVIVVRGRNYHAHDIAAVGARVAGLRPGRLAAVVLDPAGTGEEGGTGEDGGTGNEPEVRLVAEADAAVLAEPDRLRSVGVALRRALARELDLYVSTVDLLPPGGLPVTTSGKVRLGELRRRLRGSAAIDTDD